jgi:threonine/homoserine/homoserine lactone efflux protein
MIFHSTADPLLTLAAGLIVGFLVAIPVGPMGVLSLQRSINGRPLLGFLTGVGIAFADAVYAAVAAFGLTLISDFLIGQHRWLSFAGGLILLVFGVATFRSCPKTAAHTAARGGPWWVFLSSAGMTFTNPATIFTFVVLFTTFRFGADLSMPAALALVGGVFVGSCGWWLLLTHGASRWRTNFSESGLRRVNRAAGVLIIGFGLWALGSGLMGERSPSAMDEESSERTG